MKSFILDNGLRVVTSSSPTNTVYLGLAMDAGTRDELDNESGMAHFAEHLSFKGTHRRTSRQIITRMESVGGDLNAFTGKEETVYYCSCQREHFPRALDLLLDIVFHSTYPQAEMDKEVEVVIDEIESCNDSPSDLIYDDFESMLFQGHPLGRSILGKAECLRNYHSEDVARYTQRLYTVDRAVLFVYGNITSKDIIKIISRRHTTNNSPTTILPSGCPEDAFGNRIPPSSYNTPQSRTIHKDTHQAHIMMGARAYGACDPRHLPLFLANNILGGPGLSSRLNIALRERRGLVYSADSTLTTYTDTGIWAVYFGCDHKDVSKCKQLVKRELIRLCDAPLSDKALNAAKRQISGQIALSHDNFENVAIGMGKRMLHYGRTQTKEELIARIQSLTAEQVWEASKEIFNPDRLTILEYR